MAKISPIPNFYKSSHLMAEVLYDTKVIDFNRLSSGFNKIHTCNKRSVNKEGHFSWFYQVRKRANIVNDGRSYSVCCGRMYYTMKNCKIYADACRLTIQALKTSVLHASKSEGICL